MNRPPAQAGTREEVGNQIVAVGREKYVLELSDVSFAEQSENAYMTSYNGQVAQALIIEMSFQICHTEVKDNK